MKAAIDQKNNSITFSVNVGLYSKDIIYKACYVFIDKMYIYLDTANKKNNILVTLRGKIALKKSNIEKLEGEFVNELLNSLVRENVSKRNQKILEQIIGGAMGASLGMGNMQNDLMFGDDGDDKESKEIEAAVEALKRELAEIESSGDYEDDSLGIREIITNGTRKVDLKGNNKSNKKGIKKNNGKKKKH